jgi:hypothetical protein
MFYSKVKQPYPAYVKTGAGREKVCNRISFGEGRVNILAAADNHGHIEKLPALYDTVTRNSDSIFPKKNDQSTLNVFAIAGDWFIDLKQQGYKSQNQPEKLGFQKKDTQKMTAGFYNIFFLNKFVDFLNRKMNNNKELSAKSSIKTLYTPGNHCLEDGDYYLAKILKYSNNDMKTILSNINLNNSPAFNKIESIKEKEILEVTDDKDPTKKHKVLVLGLTINTADFYCKNKMPGTDVLDRTAKKTEQLRYPDDIKETIKRVYSHIESFKQKYPNSAVVVMNHNGNAFSSALVEGIDDLNISNQKELKIDVILNGHDHKDKTVTVGKNNTKIVSLGQNNKKFESVQLHFDDDGRLDISTKRFPVDNKVSSIDNPMQQLLNNIFKADFERNIKINITDPNCPGRVLEQINELSCDDIRFKNSALANFITDTVLQMIHKKDRSIDIFGISSSAIRGNLPVNNVKANNIEIMNLLCGITDDDSTIFQASLKGSELAQIIAKNIFGNMLNKNRNELIQWSGVQINRDEIIQTFKQDNKSKDNLTQFNIRNIYPYIKTKQIEETNYQALDPDKIYKVAVPAEALKNKISEFSDRFTKFTSEELKAKQLIKDYLDAANNNVSVKDPGADIRIITRDNEDSVTLNPFNINQNNVTKLSA